MLNDVVPDIGDMGLNDDLLVVMLKPHMVRHLIALQILKVRPTNCSLLHTHLQELVDRELLLLLLLAAESKYHEFCIETPVRDVCITHLISSFFM